MPRLAYGEKKSAIEKLGTAGKKGNFTTNTSMLFLKSFIVWFFCPYIFINFSWFWTWTEKNSMNTIDD